MFKKLKKKKKVCCPECNRWYAENAMVVLNYGEPNQSLVCIGCYEDNHFIPPKSLKEAEDVGNY